MPDLRLHVAYAISRLKHRWTKGFLYVSLATRLVP